MRTSTHSRISAKEIAGFGKFSELRAVVATVRL